MDNAQLIETANAARRCRQLTDECIVGEVSSALLTAEGNVYTGISISTACGIGFCAEHSAVAQMVTAGESRIRKIVALSEGGRVIPPCGRCRELLYQVDRGNLRTEVVLGLERSMTLVELLPERWQELWE